MANTSAIRQQAAHPTYQLSSPSCSTRDIRKSPTLHKKCCWTFWEKSWENGPLAERWPDRKSKRTRQKKQERRWERGTKWQPWDSGLGDRKTREEIGKGTQMTALRFQTGGKTTDISGPTSGPTRARNKSCVTSVTTVTKIKLVEGVNWLEFGLYQPINHTGLFQDECTSRVSSPGVISASRSSSFCSVSLSGFSPLSCFIFLAAAIRRAEIPKKTP